MKNLVKFFPIMEKDPTLVLGYQKINNGTQMLKNFMKKTHDGDQENNSLGLFC